MIHIEQLQRKTDRYAFADGIPDFQAALIWFVQGIMFWLMTDALSSWRPALNRAFETQDSGLVNLGLGIAAFAVPLGILAIGSYLLRVWLRERWLWPRLGVVKPKAWVVPRVYVLASLALTMGIFFLGILFAIQTNQFEFVYRSMFVGAGMGQACLMLLTARRFDLSHTFAAGLLGAVVSPLFLLISASIGGFALMFAFFWTILLTTTGLWSMAETRRAAVDGE